MKIQGHNQQNLSANLSLVLYSLAVYSKKLYKLDSYERDLRITVDPVGAPERILATALSALPGGVLVKKHPEEMAGRWKNI